MSSRPVTPVSPIQSARPDPSIHSARPTSARISSRPISYVGTQHTQPIDTGSQLNHSQAGLQDPSALAQAADLHDEVVNQNQESLELPRTNSHMSGSQTLLPSRGGTLKKKASLHKSASIKRTASKRSSYAGSVRSLQLGEKEKYEETPETNSVFYCPVPTTGNPTELLAIRFQAWRKVLKDLINYFRELHKTYETRAKALMSTSNVINNTTIPPNFLSQGGVGDAAYILRDFHKQGLNEANKARDLENEVIIQLTGLRSDLQQKIKEIKSLSGDFKNSVDKEKEATKRAVQSLQEALGSVDHDAASTSGKGDPFLVKLALDKQIERQIDEENYLHRAYLNLEASGRELESIVVGEIQKAYNVLAGILRREADENYDTAEKLKEGPLAMAKDHEWDEFTTNNSQMVDPRIPIRQVSHIVYPGKDHPAAIEVRSGMLERKSKYLKNYTPGWYVLSPTHLHEFKSADRIAFQAPVMSLYLPEQKLGSHSELDSSSHKFMLKGRQTGSMHRGHAWVFRAESHDTMLAWFNDIKELTEKRGEERNEFVRRTHARSFSGNSLKPASIISSEGGLEDDEADRVAFSGEQSVRGNSIAPPDQVAVAGLGGLGVGAASHDNEDNRSEAGWRPPQQRPAPGGRFPSDLNVQRGLQAPLSPSSGESSDRDRDVIAAAGGLPGSGVPFANTMEKHTDLQPEAHQPAAPAPQLNAANQYTQGHHPNIFPAHPTAPPHDGASEYGEWMAPIGAGGGAAAGAALAASTIHRHKQQQEQDQRDRDRTPTAAQRLDGETAIPQYGESSAPIPAVTAAPIDAPTEPRAMSESTTAPSSAVANTISSGTDAGTLSTVPTSTGYTAPNGSLFDANGVFVGPREAKTAPTEYTLRPAQRSHSHTTISHLHVPGEFPTTLPLNEDSRVYRDVVQH
ncbi:PH domain protein [Cladophialophora carrionii]|uniref:PH domain protein n=1 Tax=Cladophialophora carrionii TaxID=86049 RepID=A0A1C1CJK7_9EURO|nr:PH domain protein [Cladophialophora carrionii]